jgi:deoxycytidylate deaminase
MIVNAGIIKVFYLEPYEDELTKQMASEAGIELVNFSEVVGSISDKNSEVDPELPNSDQ